MRRAEHIGRLERWLVREPEHDVPSTMGEATEMITADMADLRALADVLPADEFAVRLTVDTDTLIDNPDLAAHVPTLGRRYMTHLLPVVLREIDDLRRSGRAQDLRDAAQRADRRLKGLRTTAISAPVCAFRAMCTRCSNTSSHAATGYPPG